MISLLLLHDLEVFGSMPPVVVRILQAPYRRP